MIKSMKEHTLCTRAIHIEINFGNKNMSIFIMTHFYTPPPPPPEQNELHELILFNVQNKYVRYSIYEAKQNKSFNNNNNNEK